MEFPVLPTVPICVGHLHALPRCHRDARLVAVPDLGAVGEGQDRAQAVGPASATSVIVPSATATSGSPK